MSSESKSDVQLNKNSSKYDKIFGPDEIYDSNRDEFYAEWNEFNEKVTNTTPQQYKFMSPLLAFYDDVHEMLGTSLDRESNKTSRDEKFIELLQIYLDHVEEYLCDKPGFIERLDKKLGSAAKLERMHNKYITQTDAKAKVVEKATLYKDIVDSITNCFEQCNDDAREELIKNAKQKIKYIEMQERFELVEDHVKKLSKIANSDPNFRCDLTGTRAKPRQPINNQWEESYDGFQRIIDREERRRSPLFEVDIVKILDDMFQRPPENAKAVSSHANFGRSVRSEAEQTGGSAPSEIEQMRKDAESAFSLFLLAAALQVAAKQFGAAK